MQELPVLAGVRSPPDIGGVDVWDLHALRPSARVPPLQNITGVSHVAMLASSFLVGLLCAFSLPSAMSLQHGAAEGGEVAAEVGQEAFACSKAVSMRSGRIYATGITGKPRRGPHQGHPTGAPCHAQPRLVLRVSAVLSLMHLRIQEGKTRATGKTQGHAPARTRTRSTSAWDAHSPTAISALVVVVAASTSSSSDRQPGHLPLQHAQPRIKSKPDADALLS